MSTINKRVSQLTEMSATDVQPNDLLLIIDTTAQESKNITILDFETYIRGIGNITTLSYTASYVLGSGVDGYVNLAYNSNTSSFSNYSTISSQSYNSNTASWAMSASAVSLTNIPTSSYLNYSPNNGTASYSINSNTSNISNISNFLYYLGGNNGTASYAITAREITNTQYAQTASYFENVGNVSLLSSSYAQVAGYSLGGVSNSTNYLNYSPNNGTASYAMTAKTIANFITPQGIFLSTTQSSNASQYDDIDVYWSTGNNALTPIESIGTIDIPFTSSMFVNGNICLGIIDRNTGFNTILDYSPISFNISPTVGTWGTYDSGSVSIPFTLAGQPSLYGSYLVYVSASNNLRINNNRNVRFNISTLSDTFNAYVNVPLIFTAGTSNNSPVIFSFTSTIGGPFSDTAANINYSMSLGQSIFTISSLEQNLSSLNYFWTVNGIISASFSGNSDFNNMSGVPNTTEYLVCSKNPLNYLYSFASSSLMYLDCSYNYISSLPQLPTSMSYIDCSYNYIGNITTLPLSLSYFNCSNQNGQLTSLPSILPSGLTVFLAGNNPTLPSSSIPSILPDTITTMSFDNDSLINNISYLPMSLSYLSVNNTNISSLPTIPQNVLYLSAQSCSLSTLINPFSMDDIAESLLYNAINYSSINGTLDLRGNGPLNPASTDTPTQLPPSGGYVYQLVNNYGWTALYD